MGSARGPWARSHRPLASHCPSRSPGDATDGGGWRITAIAVIVVAGLVVLVTVGRRVERLDGKLTS
jgi:hypothetical protein